MNNDKYSDDNKVHDTQRLKELQALPLERKVLITQSRILEWYNYWNGQVYISFSGGKDSTVLLHIVRNLFPDVEAVFVDTGLEYPERRAFALGGAYGKIYTTRDMLRKLKGSDSNDG